MKKPYEKPMLYAESFTLVEHIASACEGAIDFGTPVNAQDMSCGFKLSESDPFFPGLTLFMNGSLNCEVEGMSYEAGIMPPAFGTS